MPLLRIGNRYIQTEAIAAASYRPGRDAIYSEADDERLIRDAVPHGISIRLVSGGFDYEFEGDEVVPLKQWLDNESGGFDAVEYAKTNRRRPVTINDVAEQMDPFAGRQTTPFVGPSSPPEAQPSPQGAVAPSGTVEAKIIKGPVVEMDEEDEDEGGDDMALASTVASTSATPPKAGKA